MRKVLFYIILNILLSNTSLILAQRYDLEYYNSKVDKFWHSNLDSAKFYSELAYKLSFTSNNWIEVCKAKANKGISSYNGGDYKKALLFYDSTIALAKKHNLPTAKYIILKSNALRNKARYIDAIEFLNVQVLDSSMTDINKFDLYRSLLSLVIELGRINEAEEIFAAVGQLYLTDEQLNSNSFLFLKAEYFNKVSNFSSSDSIAHILLERYNNKNNYLDKSSILNLLGDNAMQVGNYDTSLQLLSQASLLLEKAGYNFGQAQNHMLLGSLHSYLGEFEIASNYLYDALEIFDKNENLNEVLKAYYELGWIYYERSLYNRAIEYLQKSIRIAKDVGNYNYLGSSYNALGNVYFAIKEYDNALSNYFKACEIKDKSKDIKGYAASKFNAALVYDEIGQKDKALEIYLETYQIDKDLNNQLGMAIGEYSLAKFYSEENQTEKGISYILLSVERLEKLNIRHELAQAYKIASKIFARNKNYLKSNQFLEAYSELKDKSYQLERNNEIDKLEVKYKLKNYEQQIKLLGLEKVNAANELYIKEATIKNQKIFIYIGIIAAFVLILLLYITYRFLSIRSSANKKLTSINKELSETQEEIVAQSEELQEANDQIREMNIFLEERVKERTKELMDAQSNLDLFFYKASHDFRGPITTFMGIAEVAELSLQEPKSLELFKRVKYTATKLDKMVRKLQSISLLSTKVIEHIEKQEITIHQLFNNLEEEFEDLKSNKAVQILFKHNVDKIKFYADHLMVILEVLIENGIIFNYNAKPTVEIEILLKGNSLVIIVSDNGKGIPESEFETIFEMFRRTSIESNGNGLGLFLLKKIVTNLEGKIKLESDIGKGSKFEIIMPYE